MTMASSINVITAALTSTAIRRISVIATKELLCCAQHKFSYVA